MAICIAVAAVANSRRQNLAREAALQKSPGPPAGPKAGKLEWTITGAAWVVLAVVAIWVVFDYPYGVPDSELFDPNIVLGLLLAPIVSSVVLWVFFIDWATAAGSRSRDFRKIGFGFIIVISGYGASIAGLRSPWTQAENGELTFPILLVLVVVAVSWVLLLAAICVGQRGINNPTPPANSQ